MPTRPVADLLATLAEPTPLRILNCISKVPLFASDLAAILAQSEAAVTETMAELQRLEIVRTFSIMPHLLYGLAPLHAQRERMVRSALDAVHHHPAAQRDRAAARQRSRTRLAQRVHPPVVDAS